MKSVATPDVEVIGIAHLSTAIAYYIIAGVLLWMAAQLWKEHPVNRVFRLGPYLTEEGLRALLNGWYFVFLFGAFILSCAIDHTLDFLVHKGWMSATALRTSAVSEAVISLGTAFFVVAAVARHKWRAK